MSTILILSLVMFAGAVTMQVIHVVSGMRKPVYSPDLHEELSETNELMNPLRFDVLMLTNYPSPELWLHSRHSNLHSMLSTHRQPQALRVEKVS